MTLEGRFTFHSGGLVRWIKVSIAKGMLTFKVRCKILLHLEEGTDDTTVSEDGRY